MVLMYAGLEGHTNLQICSRMDIDIARKQLSVEAQKREVLCPGLSIDFLSWPRVRERLISLDDVADSGADLHLSCRFRVTPACTSYTDAVKNLLHPVIAQNHLFSFVCKFVRRKLIELHTCVHDKVRPWVGHCLEHHQGASCLPLK